MVSEEGILGFENEVDKILDAEFELIKDKINEFLQKQTPEQKRETQLLALKYKIEDYIEKN
jgi:hypothetical protein